MVKIFAIGLSINYYTKGAFADCNNLATINLPNSIISIGDVAFRSCPITSITIPNSVKTMVGSPFLNCNKLETININASSWSSWGDNRKEIQSVLYTSAIYPNDWRRVLESNIQNQKRNQKSDFKVWFTDINNLTLVNIGNEVKLIPDFAFTLCNTLISISIPNSVMSIGEASFAGCNLTSVTIPNSVTTIKECAFDGCNNLETVNFNAINCKVMGSEKFPVFSDCKKLSELNIGNEVQIIPAYAFMGLKGLKSITIPSSVKIIGEMAFKDCSNITEFICYAVVPPELKTSLVSRGEYASQSILTFEGTNLMECTLMVPKESIKAYKKAKGWKDFKEIKAID